MILVNSLKESSQHMLSHENFLGLLNSTFTVPGPEGTTVELNLEEVSELKSFPRQETFSVVFRGPREVFLMQATHKFHHDSIGDFDIFIVPIGPDANGFRYESVFNRLVNTEEAVPAATN